MYAIRSYYVPVEEINLGEFLDTANASTWGGIEEYAEHLIKTICR